MGMFSSPKMPETPKAPPAPMQMTDPALIEARRRARLAAMGRRGWESTILTSKRGAAPRPPLKTGGGGGGKGGGYVTILGANSMGGGNGKMGGGSGMTGRVGG